MIRKLTAAEMPLIAAKETRKGRCFIALSLLLKACLAGCVENKLSLQIYLLSGISLNGILEDYDAETLLISHKGTTSLLYQQMISTLCVASEAESKKGQG